MLAITNLSYFIGGRALYENASLHIKPKDKIGLIGLNGTGKSTLLRIINGDYQTDGGEITKRNDCTIGYLNQDLLSYQSDDSILLVAMQAFKETIDIQRKMDKIIHQMETNYEDKLVNKLTRLQEQFEALDGYTMQSKAEEILEGIGFKTADLTRPLREFSGGWRMRVMLAKLLLEKPALLMLDEPTNHLDLPSIEWVENYLRNYEGAVIVVSHDRQFLDNTINSTVEVTNQQLIQYSGNYSFYVSEKELRSEIQKNAFENQQSKIRQTERFVERFRAKSTKAKQVQSRVKALDRLDRIEDVLDENATVNFNFEFKQQSGRYIIDLKDISKNYGDLHLLKRASAIMERGDKIALIGANGQGKSTLLRIIAGTEKVEGERNEGYNVKRAFFAQHQLESLHVENEILEELKQAGSGKTEQELRNVLGCFLFRDEDVFKKIKVLSGGEKSRVALAKTLISEANFLLLDEPTNHLDMQSESILIQAMQQYKGSFIVVSHNRHFVSSVANKVWFIEDQLIKEYPGTYDEYIYWNEKRKLNKSNVSSQKPKTKEKKESNTQKVTKEKSIKQSLEKQLVQIENSISEIETNKKLTEVELSKSENYNDSTKFEKINAKFKNLERDLDRANTKWEELVTELDELEKTN